MTQVSPAASTPVGLHEACHRRPGEDSAAAAGSISESQRVQSIPGRAPDSAEISETARLISRGHEPGVRSDLVFKMRAEIRSGEYDDMDPAKLDAIADRILRDAQDA